MILLRRDDWGADPQLPRRGHPIGPERRSEVVIHHTVVIDSDATVNDWESLDEVTSKMRQLQRLRPDLGLDVPYSMVAFCMADGGLVICEGRGLERTGAHTRGHNRSALGIAFQGDFESGALPAHIDAQLDELAQWLRSLRNTGGFRNLGNSRPERAQVWGHRDVPKARTLCPGRTLYAKLESIRFIDEADETAMDKPTWKLIQRALQAQRPPLYAGKTIDGKPGRNTNIALRAFEKRMRLDRRGVVGELDSPRAAIWPATRELLIATTYGQRKLA